MSLAKTALPNPTTQDIRIFVAQQSLQRLKCKVIALNNFIQYGHCQSAQLF